MRYINTITITITIDIVLFSLLFFVLISYCLLLGVDSLEVDRFVGFVYSIFFYFSVFVKVSCFFVSSFWFSHYRSWCFQSVSILPRLSHLQKVIPFASLCFNPTRN